MLGYVYRPLDAACKYFYKGQLPQWHIITIVTVIGIAVAAIRGGIGVGAISLVHLHRVTIAAGADRAVARWAIFVHIHRVAIATRHAGVAIFVITVSGVAHARA